MTTITGTAGADTLDGTSGDDSISGLGGNDTIDAGAGVNIIDGGAGFNVISFATVVTAGARGDLHTMQAGDYSAPGPGSPDGGAASDTLYNIQGVIGSAYRDSIVGDLNANSLFGGGSDDFLDGSGGADTLNGGGDNDWLRAGEGNDLLTGGTGNDVFKIDGSGQKSVTDFIHGQDKIDLATNGYDNFEQLKPLLSQNGADTVLNVTVNGQLTRITLKNVALNTLTSGDFLFGPSPPANLANVAIVGGHVDAYHNFGGQLTGTAGMGASITVYDGATLLGTVAASSTTGAWIYYLGQLTVGPHSLTATATDMLGDVSLASGPLDFTVNAPPTVGPATITGSNFAETITGTSGADSIMGLHGADSIVGGNGADTLDGGYGVNTIDGGGGFNIVTYAASQHGVAGDLQHITTGYSVSGDYLDDTLHNVQGVIGTNYGDSIAGDLNANSLSGGGGDDLLTGGGGADTLNGGAGDDLLRTGEGNDLLTGGPGNDVFRIDGSGQKSVTDFVHGQDKIDITKAGYADFEQLKPLLSQSGADTVLNITLNGQSTRITLKNVALNALGASDFRTRTPPPTNLADVGVVGGYVDAYHNLGGQALTGAAEFGDLIHVYDGATLLGTVTASSATGAWSYRLGQLAVGPHSLTATATDRLGEVSAMSSALAFTVNAPPTAGPATITGSIYTETLTGTSGADSINGLDGDDWIRGGDGNDTIAGGYGDAFIDGGAGFNVISFANATTSVSGYLDPLGSSFSINGGIGEDSLHHIQGVIGSAYRDSIIGDLNANLLSGGGGNDTVYGGGGADTLAGNTGDDQLEGDAGADLFRYLARQFGHDVIRDFAAGDKIDVAALGVSDLASLTPFMSQVGSDVVITLGYGGGGEQITLKGGSLAALTASSFIFNAAATPLDTSGTGLADILFGGAGADSLSGLNGADSLVGGSGVDSLNGGGGDDQLRGGPGSDVFIYDVRQFGRDLIVDFTAGDRIDLSALGVSDLASLQPFMKQVGSDVVITLGYYDAPEQITVKAATLAALTASSFIFNTAATPVVASGTSLADVLFGGSGADSLTGFSGADVLVGGSGGDTLKGGAGADTLIGGAGADKFVFGLVADGAKTITDFSDAQGDQLLISHTGFGGGLIAGATLDASRLVNGSATTAAKGQFLFDGAGHLYWDVDGTGPAARVLIATLTGVTTLFAHEILIN